jgi:hypothetical protein
VERIGSFACQLCVGETLASDLRHKRHEAVGIVQRVVFRRTIVEAEYLLIKVTIKMERLNSNVGSAKGTPR